MDEVEIKVRDNGPLKVTGPIRLIDPDGNELPLPDGPVVLCRCGKSKHKPFCDRSHREDVPFDSRVRAAESSLPPE
jgi:CDGSH-type Zn-finger protein